MRIIIKSHVLLGALASCPQSTCCVSAAFASSLHFVQESPLAVDGRRQVRFATCYENRAEQAGVTTKARNSGTNIPQATSEFTMKASLKAVNVGSPSVRQLVLEIAVNPNTTRSQ